MVVSLPTKVTRLEEATGGTGGGGCSECGGDDFGPDDSYEIVWVDPGGPEDVETFCETCGRQTGIVIRWPEDMP